MATRKRAPRRKKRVAKATPQVPALSMGPDGVISLTEEQLLALLESHASLVSAIPEVDQNLAQLAKDGSLKAVELFYRRIGLMRQGSDHNPKKPDLPDVPTHELWAELKKRKEVKAVEATEAKEP